MNKYQITKILSILLVGAALLTGCKDTDVDNPQKAPDNTEVSFIDPAELKYKSVAVWDYEPCYESKKPTHFDSVIAAGNSYQFAPEVTPEEREHFFEKHELLLWELDNKRVSVTEGYTFRILHEYMSRSDSDASTAYYGVEDIGTWKHVLATVQTLYGDSTTYGYMYAMANSLAAELGWETDVKPESYMPGIFYEMPEMLTLTYPCFISRYSTDDRINAAAAMSLDLFSKMEKPYSGEDGFIAKAKEYATANMIEYPEISFRFTSGSEYCIMGIETDYLDILMDYTFEFDFCYSGSGYQYDPWESDLTTMYSKLSHLVERLGDIKSKLGGEPPEWATIRLTHGGQQYTLEEFAEFNYASHDTIPYCMLTHSINNVAEIYARYSIDSVADEETYNGWYYNMLYLYLAHEETSKIYSDAMTPDDRAWAEYYTGTSIDTPEGMIKYYEVIIYWNSGETEPKKWVTNLEPYWEAVAFADYLVEKYGEKSFIQLMLHPTRNMEYLGTQTYKVLLEWEQYIINDCPKMYPAVVDPYLLYFPTTTQKMWSDGIKENVNGGNIYRFDSSISGDDRSDIIGKQKDLISHIEEATGNKLTGLTINLTVDSDARSHSDSGLICFGKDEAGTWKQIFATLGAVYGDYTNYGYLYALSDKIASGLGWERDTAGSIDLSVFAENPMLISLESPAFHSNYSTAEEIATAKAVSLELLGKMASPYSGDGEYKNLISTYAASHNIAYTPTHLRFAYNGRTCPVKIKTSNLEFFVSSTYTADDYFKKGYIKENWLSNITSMIRLIEEKDAEAAEANKFFGFEPPFPLTVWLKGEVYYEYSNGYVEDVSNNYNPYYVYMETSAIDWFLYNYALHIDNYISTYCADALWSEGALAYYYAREYTYQDFKFTTDKGTEEFFIYYMGTPLESVEEFISATDVIKYTWYPDYLPEEQDPYGQTSSILSLASYIVRNWGEEKFYKVMLDPNTAEAVLGKPITEVVSEWSSYIINEIPELYPKFKEN